MGHWVYQQKASQKARDYSGQVTETYEASKGQGEAESLVQGYVFGVVQTIDGRSWALTSRNVEPKNDAFELVHLTFVSPQGARARSGIKFRDGKTRTDGEEQWTLTGSLPQDATWYHGRIQDSNANGYYPTDDLIREWMPPNKGQDAVAWDGVRSTDQAKESGTTVRGTLVRQPAMFLIWKKWLNKDTAGARVKTLPESASEALSMVDTYKPGGSGTYESGAPKLMHVLPGSDKKLLCVDISIYEDGDMVCREARFEYNAEGFKTGTKEPYGE